MASVPKVLRAEIDKANKRLKRLAAAGIKSQAAEIALTALQRPNFNLGRNPTLSQVEQTKRIVERFLKAETSTIRGYKSVEKRQQEGLSKWLDSVGLSNVKGEIVNELTKLNRMGIRLRDIIQVLNIPSDVIIREMGLAAEASALDAFMFRLIEDYKDAIKSPKKPRKRVQRKPRNRRKRR